MGAMRKLCRRSLFVLISIRSQFPCHYISVQPQDSFHFRASLHSPLPRLFILSVLYAKHDATSHDSLWLHLNRKPLIQHWSEFSIQNISEAFSSSDLPGCQKDGRYCVRTSLAVFPHERFWEHGTGHIYIFIPKKKTISAQSLSWWSYKTDSTNTEGHVLLFLQVLSSKRRYR